MRKLLVFCWVLLISLLLFSCNSNTKIKYAIKLEVVDIAYEYQVNAKSLQTYYYLDDPGITYVNIEEFLKFMDGLIVKFAVDKIKNLELTSYLNGEIFKIIFDADKDSIYISNFDLLMYINTNPITQYQTDLYLAGFSVLEGNSEVIIDLTLYDMEIVKEKNKYYMPLYLANLFLTGYNIELYEINDCIYVYDMASDLTKLFDQFAFVEKKQKIDDVKLHTKNYLALYFDYFYGLKPYYNIDSYRDILNEYGFEVAQNFYELYDELDKFINYLDDIHTSIVTTGYMGTDYEPKIEEGKRLNYIGAYSTKCQSVTNEVDVYLLDDILHIKINAFSLETKELLEEVMKFAHNDKASKIVIDLSCNTGGNIIGIIETLVYLTNQNISVSYINAQTNTKITESYKSSQNKVINSNFYIITSEVTYSAANLFVSIVKDLELGLIIGEKSSGGAAAVILTTLPDGAIIVNSSNITFINKDEIIIEEGIIPDIQYQQLPNINELFYTMEHLFSYYNELVIDKNVDGNDFYYHFSIKLKDEKLDEIMKQIEVEEYVFEVYSIDEKLGLQLQSYQFFYDNEFNFHLEKKATNQKVRLYVKYKIKNMVIEEVLYEDIIN